MRQLLDIAKDEENMTTIVQLTNTFESLASMKISQTKNQVLQAQNFFNELWKIYIQIRVDKMFRFGRKSQEAVVSKDLFIIISATGGFSGDIDQRLVTTVLKDYKPDRQDIIVVGHHGATLLTQQGVSYKKYFKLPESDQHINVEPLVREIRQYNNTVVYYQSYVSLMNQEIKSIELRTAVKALSEHSSASEEIISERTYIFEPSTHDVVMHLERSMLQIALSQVIFESKLAQYASRFRAMTVAHDRSEETLDSLHLLYNRTKRNIRDEQLKQIIAGIKKVSSA